MKEYEILSPLNAAKLIEENPEGLLRYFRNMTRTAQRRAKTFEKHDRTDAYGYERLRSAISIARHGMTPETLSYLTQTLASKRTSYAESREIDRRIIRTLQDEFGEDFISESDLDEFGRAMEAFRASHISKMYGSDTIAEMVMQEIRSGHVRNWHEYFINFGKEGSEK